MRILIGLCFLLMSIGVNAQERPVQLKQGEALSGVFSQKRYLSGFERPIESKGVFNFNNTAGLVWKTLVPFETELVINQDGLSQSLDGQETLSISVDQFPTLKTLHVVLSLSMQGRWDALEEEFGTKFALKDNGWSMAFNAPEDVPFKSIYIEGEAHLGKLVITKMEGDRDEITFAEQRIVKVE